MSKNTLIERTLSIAANVKVCISQAYDSLQHIPMNSSISIKNSYELPSNVHNQALDRVIRSFSENNETRNVID
ncbi:hypothetical protein BMR1_03g02595 [Babesia microti strain RI]|uniref:Uncharacterized protein n=1 Tax=Babesia microti (strain RI) TaxID=1133968 RepID=A0A0K3AN16_BABMR|nr:hypothetical protein BMR1_03g02595 [Babesia microti strain RI]CTQ41119.1 hypothetical protein BMR1_03g02595 [Babesia microti strain RI]|eukprot:XP_012649130.1 hypothetical protein BMR1_03g02595 [Babesia microti strain RI]